MNLLQGSVVKSIAGHDKNRYFVVVKIDDQYVYIADGKERKLEKPKRKNVKHIAVTSRKFDLNEITNKKLRKLLNEYGQKVNKNSQKSQNFKS